MDPSLRLIMAALSVVSVGAVTGAIAWTNHIASNTAAKTAPVETLKAEPKLYCQPFQTETERNTNEYYLRRDGYRVVMAQEVERAYQDHSAGQIEMIQQTQRECFYENFITQKFPVNTLYEKKLPKPKGVK